MKSKLSLLLAIFGTLTAGSFALANDYYISGESTIGCSNKDDYNQLIRYAVDGDQSAFTTALTAGLMAGSCTVFESGQDVYLVDVGIFSGLTKVRPAGGIQEYWTNSEAVTDY